MRLNPFQWRTGMTRTIRKTLLIPPTVSCIVSTAPDREALGHGTDLERLSFAGSPVFRSTLTISRDVVSRSSRQRSPKQHPKPGLAINYRFSDQSPSLLSLYLCLVTNRALFVWPYTLLDTISILRPCSA